MLTPKIETRIRESIIDCPKPIAGSIMSQAQYDFIATAWDDVQILLAEIDRLRDVLTARDAAIKHGRSTEEIDQNTIKDLQGNLKMAVHALEQITQFCSHDEPGNLELCDCSTSMSLLAKDTLSRIRGQE